jgi:hypothetical protein
LPGDRAIILLIVFASSAPVEDENNASTDKVLLHNDNASLHRSFSFPASRLMKEVEKEKEEDE